MTQEQWYESPDLMPRLAEILRDPAVTAALDILRDQDLIPLVAPNGVGNLVDYFALMGSKRTGYLEFLTNLRALSHPRPKPKEDPRAWETPKK